MKAIINSTLIQHLTPKNKPFDVWDEKLTGFFVRVNISGKMVYMCQYGRGKRITIGKVGILSPAQARDRAKEILGDVIKGIDPKAVHKGKTQDMTFVYYIQKHYQPWAITHRKSGSATIDRIKANFSKLLGNKSLPEITPLLIEQWRANRLKNGIKTTTINRDIIALKASLTKAIEWELIEINPIAKLKLCKTDTHTNVRFLTSEEETRFRQALDVREEKIRLARDSGNVWRQKRGYPERPNLRNQHFVDAIKPMILLSLNTGLRRGELFSLTWKDINLSQAILTVKGESAKSNKTRHIPLNSEALETLQAWQRQQKMPEELVFPNKQGKRLTHVKRSWKHIITQAAIAKFRWHDMRHHFASSLVMAGVDLNTVRELLGHADIKMTLIYAHLSPEHKAQAVAKLMTWRNAQNSSVKLSTSCV